MAEITEFGPRKTIFILAIVAGCFAVLWPKIFYPMLAASVSPHHTPDTACCDVIFDSDVTAADIMHEICQNIVKHHQVDPRVRDALKASKLTRQSASLCREEVLARCDIDLSAFLAERERLGKSYKQVFEEIRTFNSSLCLKTHFGIPLSQLGTPHLIRYHILMPHSTIKQERRTPPHAGGLHPALRERGRAIPSAHIVPRVADRPDHVVPKMRPPLGGAGHVAQSTKGNGTMGIIMPLYTIGIVLFFLYTIVKVLKKTTDSEIICEYPSVAAEQEFQKMVFNPDMFATAFAGENLRSRKEKSPRNKSPVPTIQELKDLNGAPKSKRLAGVNRSSKEDTADQDVDTRPEEELEILEHSPTVKVMGMEMTASCEGGQKGSRPSTPIIPPPPSPVEREKTPPKPIYLEGALPSQCELMVTDSETQAQQAEDDNDEAPVVLSGKMTLSLISLDQIPAESDEERGQQLRIARSGEPTCAPATIGKKAAVLREEVRNRNQKEGRNPMENDRTQKEVLRNDADRIIQNEEKHAEFQVKVKNGTTFNSIEEFHKYSDTKNEEGVSNNLNNNAHNRNEEVVILETI